MCRLFQTTSFFCFKAFDVMKEELQFAQERNANKRRHFRNNNGNFNEKVVLFKRETCDHDHDSGKCDVLLK